MNKRGIVIFSLCLLIVLFLGCTSVKPQGQESAISEPQAPESKMENEAESLPEEALTSKRVEITSSGFAPKSITIFVGEKVTFVNKDVDQHWPASAIHPTHTIYPGSDIAKCGTAEQAMIFDACHGLEPGEEFTFTFTNAGTWRYHDHLGPEFTGTVVVQ